MYWIFGVVFDDAVSFDAAEAMTCLRRDSRHFFWPINEQPIFRKMGWFKNERCPIAEHIARRALYLPSGVGLIEEEADISARALLEIAA
jgi:perosamine synthetase